MKKGLIIMILGLVFDFGISCFTALGLCVLNVNFLAPYFDFPHISYWVWVGAVYGFSMIRIPFKKVDKNENITIADFIALFLSKVFIMGVFLLVMVIIFSV